MTEEYLFAGSLQDTRRKFSAPLAQAVEYYEANKPKGEFVLVIEGAKEDELCLHGEYRGSA